MNTRSHIACLVALLLLAAALVAGCDDGEAPLLTDGGSFELTWTPAGGSVPLNEHFDLMLTVSDAGDGAPVADATVRVDARMPLHGHGMNVAPVLTANGDGSYSVEGMLFHMPGLWEMSIEVTRDGIVEQVVVPIVLEV